MTKLYIKLNSIVLTSIAMIYYIRNEFSNPQYRHEMR